MASQNFVTRPGSQFVQSGTGAVERTVTAKLQDVVSVKDFGAIGDGVVDDTSAIQAALNSGANSVVVPDGTYIVTSLLVSSALTIFGPGKLKRTTSLSSSVINITASNVVIDGISFAGASEGSTVVTQNSSDNAVLVSGTSSVSPLSNITFRSLNIDGFAGFGVFVNYAVNVIAESNYVVNCGYCGIGFLSVIEGRITNNRVKNITASTGVNYYGIFITRDPSKNLSNSARSTNCIVSNNIVSEVPKWTGIDGHAPSNWIVTNNRVYFCKNGIYAQYDDVGAAFPANAQDVIISGNIVEGPASTSDSQLGIASLGASGLINQRIKITDNIVERSGGFNSPLGAIHITFTDHAEVFNNVIDQAVRVGLSVIGTSQYVTIADNKINGVIAGASSASYMYFALGSLTAVSVARNRMLNTTGSASYTPDFGILYDGSTTTQLVMDSNRIYTAPAVARLRSTGGVNNNPSDLAWKLESETIKFNYTTTGGSSYEAVGNRSSSFRRLPDTSGTFILRSRVTTDQVPAASRGYGVVGNFGSVYTPAVYRFDATNVAAGIVLTDITFTLEGIYWTD